jgi:hypothetical protein
LLFDKQFDEKDIVVLHSMDSHDLEHFDGVVITVHEDHLKNIKPS